MGRSLAMIMALVLGGLLPSLSAFSFLIRWILVFMLWSGFLSMPLSALAPERSHLRLLAAWSIFPLAGWLLLRPLGPQAAIAGFLVGATPTATAAPTITRLLGGKPGYVTVAFLGSNLLAMIGIPLVLLWMGAPLPDGAARFLLENIAIVGLPLAMAAACHRAGWAKRLSPATSKAIFPLWVAALCLASAKTVAFLSGSHNPPTVFVGIVVGTGLLCAA
ncbi:MAG TPA: hypothetical protein PKY05_19725, partial [Fibrobacteria bacterium]|nr:hypothetical protein [Fibrobacteria bacterium]